MKLRFFINISHELRTPLTLILAPLHEMLNKVNDRWQHKQLELMKQNANRLLHLVNQLLDYRKAELGVFGLKVKPAQVHRIIEKNFRFYEALAQRKGIQYDFCSEVEDKEILCDPNYLELIVNNLLSNAFKHTEEGAEYHCIIERYRKQPSSTSQKIPAMEYPWKNRKDIRTVLSSQKQSHRQRYRTFVSATPGGTASWTYRTGQCRRRWKHLLHFPAY